jgi:hypothetical protein
MTPHILTTLRLGHWRKQERLAKITLAAPRVSSVWSPSCLFQVNSPSPFIDTLHAFQPMPSASGLWLSHSNASTPLLGVPLNGALVYILWDSSSETRFRTVQWSRHWKQPYDCDNSAGLQLDWWVLLPVNNSRLKMVQWPSLPHCGNSSSVTPPRVDVRLLALCPHSV